MTTRPDITNYPTVAEILDLPIFENSRLVAGAKGLSNIVSGFNLSDNPDYSKWVFSNEVFISTCFSVSQDPSAIDSFIDTLADRNVAAFFIKPWQFLKETPAVMIERADARNLPLIELPPDMSFSNITKAISDELIARQTALLKEVLSFNKMMNDIITEGADLDKLAEVLSDLTATSVLILDSVNRRNAIHIFPQDEPAFTNLPEIETVRRLSETQAKYELRSSNRSYGTIFFFNRQEGEIPSEIINQITHIIPLEITMKSNIRNEKNNELLDILLFISSDHFKDTREIMTRAEKAGIIPGIYHAIFKFNIGQIPKNDRISQFRQTKFISMLSAYLSRFGYKGKYIAQEQSITYIISSEKEPAEREVLRMAEELSKMILANFRELNISAGFGRFHKGLSGIKTSLRESEIALNANADTSDIITCFSSLSIQRMIYSDDPRSEIENYIHDTLGSLTNEKDAHSCELLHTLECFIKNNGNIKQVSKDLFTHYNTISYRLKTVENLTGTSLRSADDIFKLKLAIDLYRGIS